MQGMLPDARTKTLASYRAASEHGSSAERYGALPELGKEIDHR